VKNRYCIDMISILAILTNTIRYRYGIDASGIEAEPISDISNAVDEGLGPACQGPCRLAIWIDRRQCLGLASHNPLVTSVRDPGLRRVKDL
jgi:hypothetical protein